MHFATKMWHPNIYPDGKVCISILHPAVIDEYNEQESMDEKYTFFHIRTHTWAQVFVAGQIFDLRDFC